MAHESPSPLCEVDKSRLADLPRSAGVGNRTGRSEATMGGPGELVGGSWVRDNKIRGLNYGIGGKGHYSISYS